LKTIVNLAPTPLVSIVLPTYNGSRYLEQAIQSCRAQTYTNWELIVVDDASTDSTPEIVARLSKQEPRIRYVRHDENRKLPAALNTGFRNATGEYFTWTSDDNRYRPDALRAMVDVLEAHPEQDLVYADYSVIDANDQPVREVLLKGPEWLLKDNYVGACFLFRRKVFEALSGYDERLFLAEDYDFWLRAWASFRLGHLKANLYLYREHAQSLTGTKNREILKSTKRVLDQNLPRVAAGRPAFLVEGYCTLARVARMTGDIAGFVKYSIHAFMASPRLFIVKQQQKCFLPELPKTDLP
jgi:glycosyltransferase involved in cell wall biosynthesis